MIVALSEPDTPTVTTRPTGPPSRAARNVVVALTIAFTVAAWGGDLFLASLVDTHPAVFIALNARNRNLVLAQGYLDWWTFFGIGIVRLVLSDPLFFLLGRWYGDAAIRWAERKAPTYGSMFRTVEGWFARASGPMVAIAPNNVICLFAGASGMSVARFALWNVGGTVVRLVALWFAGDAFSDPLDWLRELITEHRLPVFIISAVVLGLSIWSEKRQGTLEIDMLEELDDEVAHPHPHLADDDQGAGTEGGRG